MSASMSSSDESGGEGADGRGDVAFSVLGDRDRDRDGPRDRDRDGDRASFREGNSKPKLEYAGFVEMFELVVSKVPI